MGFRVRLPGLSTVPARQFAIFRITFGVYLAYFFVSAFPYAAELFSSQGMLPKASLNYTFGFFPNPLNRWDRPLDIQFFLAILIGLSLAFTAGICRRIASLALWYGWACLYHRNNLIDNPSVFFTGWILLAASIIPEGEPLSLFGKTNPAWKMPALIYEGAWWIVACGYSISGFDKLQSPSWADGTALRHVMESPLARHGFLRELFLAQPTELIRIETWLVLSLELFFLPLIFLRITRLAVWSAMTLLHMSLLALLNFGPLSIGMLMIQLFILDRRWLSGIAPLQTGKSRNTRRE